MAVTAVLNDAAQPVPTPELGQIETPPRSTMNATAALAAVLQEVTAVSKERQGHGYQFRGIEDVLNALHGPLSRSGLILSPRVVEHDIRPLDAGNKKADAGWHYIVATVEYDAYGPDGSKLETFARITVSAEDNSDKGFGKILSYAYKAMALQVFAIPTEDTAIDNEASNLADTETVESLRTAARSLDADGQAKLREWLTSISANLKPGQISHEDAARTGVRILELAGLVAAES